MELNTSTSIYHDKLDQSVYQKYGPYLQTIATEIKPFDLTPYTYWLSHVKKQKNLSMGNTSTTSNS